MFSAVILRFSEDMLSRFNNFRQKPWKNQLSDSTTFPLQSQSIIVIILSIEYEQA